MGCVRQLSYARWLLEALFVNELQRYPSIWAPAVTRMYQRFGYTAGQAQLHRCLLVLAAQGVALRLASFIALVLTNRPAQRAA